MKTLGLEHARSYAKGGPVQSRLKLSPHHKQKAAPPATPAASPDVPVNIHGIPIRQQSTMNQAKAARGYADGGMVDKVLGLFGAKKVELTPEQQRQELSDKVAAIRAKEAKAAGVVQVSAPVSNRQRQLEEQEQAAVK